MPAESEELAIQLLNIDRKVRNTLCAVEHYGNIVGVGNVNDFTNWVNRTHYVADVGYADEFCLLGNELLESLHIEHTFVVDWDYLQNYATTLGKDLPRHDVGMVLYVGNNNLVAFLHKTFAERRSHKIKALGGATREHYFGSGTGVDELPHRFARSLVQVGSLLGKPMNATMHICIYVEILVAHGVQHAERFLRGCRIVEINQRFSVNRA